MKLLDKKTKELFKVVHISDVKPLCNSIVLTLQSLTNPDHIRKIAKHRIHDHFDEHVNDSVA